MRILNDNMHINGLTKSAYYAASVFDIVGGAVPFLRVGSKVRVKVDDSSTSSATVVSIHNNTLLHPTKANESASGTQLTIVFDNLVTSQHHQISSKDCSPYETSISASVLSSNDADVIFNLLDANHFMQLISFSKDFLNVFDETAEN